MNEIGSEQLPAGAQFAERMGDEGGRDRGPRSRRQPLATIPPSPKPEAADDFEALPHQVDSLA